jgi:hypothetical protein
MCHDIKKRKSYSTNTNVIATSFLVLLGSKTFAQTFLKTWEKQMITILQPFVIRCHTHKDMICCILWLHPWSAHPWFSSLMKICNNLVSSNMKYLNKSFFLLTRLLILRTHFQHSIATNVTICHTLWGLLEMLSSCTKYGFHHILTKVLFTMHHVCYQSTNLSQQKIK